MKGMGNSVGRPILSEGDIVPSQISHPSRSLSSSVCEGDVEEDNISTRPDNISLLISDRGRGVTN